MDDSRGPVLRPDVRPLQALVVTEQKVDQLLRRPAGERRPSLFTVLARVKNPADAVYVRDQILATLADARVEAGRRRAAGGREVVQHATRSHGRSTAPSGSRPWSSAFVPYRRSFDTVNTYYRTLDALTPADLRRRRGDTSPTTA